MFAELADTEPDEPHRPAEFLLAKQRQGRAAKCEIITRRLLEAALSRDGFEALPTQLQAHQRRVLSCAAQSAADFVDKVEQYGLQPLHRAAVHIEGVLLRYALLHPRDLDLTCILAPRQAVKMPRTVLSDNVRESSFGHGLQFADGANPVVVEHALRHAAHSPDAPHGQRRQEGRDLPPRARHDRQTVGLVQVAGQLGKELVGCYADGRGQPRFLSDLFADGPGDFEPRAEQVVDAADVEKGLVNRQRLHQGGEAFKDAEYVSGNLAVALPVHRQEDGVRAPAVGFA